MTKYNVFQCQIDPVGGSNAFRSAGKAKRSS